MTHNDRKKFAYFFQMYISNHGGFLIKITFLHLHFFLVRSATCPVHGDILFVTLNPEIFLLFKFLFYFLIYTVRKTTPEKARKLESYFIES